MEPIIRRNKPKKLILVLDNIRSILNVGAIFRTANAAGVKKIYLCGITAYPSEKEINDLKYTPPKIIDGKVFIKYEPSLDCIASFLNKRIAKTALKALDKVEFSYKKTTEDAIEELKQEKIPIVALEQDRHSVDYRRFDYPNKLAIVVGNEIDGVKRTILNLCDQILEIPMQGDVDSLNVATATGIILFKALE